MLKNKNLMIIALIAIVNALGYGIIIPILYTYSKKFGLSDAENGLLFAVFSACQFLSTPIIGRLSDKFGRKPLLIISLAGTAVSFFMAAFAPNAIILFAARMLDGLTAGNIPVASAVISDTTEGKDRAKGFAVIGASFGFGFTFGPAISGFTHGYGLGVPFIISGVIATIATLITIFFLPETNKHIGQMTHGKLFDLKKLFTSLFDKQVGQTLLISLIFSLAFGLFMFSFQPYAVKGLQLSLNTIAAIFTMFGVLGIISQGLIVPKLLKKHDEKKVLMFGLFVSAAAFLGLFLAQNLAFFIAACVLLSMSNALINPMIQTLLSRETDAKSQGSIQGLNASYVSIGTIIGPILGGILVQISLQTPFLLGSILVVLCALIAWRVVHLHFRAESAF